MDGDYFSEEQAWIPGAER